MGGSPGGRRGRPQRLRDDLFPLSAPRISVESRIGWLLATTRLLHPDEAVRQGDRFCALALQRGLHVDRSRISRWESGAVAAGPQVLDTYEALLGRPAESLSSVAETLRRAFGDQVLRTRHSACPPAAALDGLLDPALDNGEVSGCQWQELARRLTAYDAVYLRHDDWDRLAARLVAELGRAAGPAYVHRFGAAARLVRHPCARGPLSRALSRYLADPDTQVVLPVLWLLTEVHDPAAGDLVLRMLASDRERLRGAAASVASVQLRRGLLAEPGLRRLEGYAVDALRRAATVDTGLDVFDLVSQLSPDSFQRVMTQVPDRHARVRLDRARSSGELVSPRQAAQVVADLAAAVQADETGGCGPDEPDLMLRRLLREALFHVHKSRRHHAAVLLAASPYRLSVSRQVQRMAGACHPFLAARAWTVLMQVGHTGQGPDILGDAMRERRPAVRSRALVSIGLHHPALPHRAARALVTSMSTPGPDSTRHGTLFALGMSGSRLLAELAEDECPDVRRAARWWRTQGAVVRE